MPLTRRSQLRSATALGVIGTLSVILPAFLTGAMAVQVRADLSMSEFELGLAIGSFFVGSATGSTLLGRLAERLGPIPAIRLGLAVSVAADLAIAAAATGPLSLVGLLVVAGLANALTQPAINLLLVRTVEPGRLGVVMALKQSGMPGAALVGGLAVPVLALTVGWRAGYLLAALLALLAVFLTAEVARHQKATTANDPTGIGDQVVPASSDTSITDRVGPDVDRGRAKPDLAITLLLLMAAVGVLGGGAANILVGYLVSGAVEAGVSPGPAGLLLTLGSALGIASRLAHGWMADRNRFDVLGRVITLFAVGALGAVGLAGHNTATYLLATAPAFAAGWAWPGLFNLVVVNTNRSAPAAATGITQTGVYVGSLIGPIVAGLLVEQSGYRSVWLLTAAAMAGASMFAYSLRRSLLKPGADRSERAGAQVERTDTTR